MKPPETLLLRIDNRELATILGALRFHQDENLQGTDAPTDIPDLVVRDIATDGGTLIALSYTEVDQLCQRLNEGSTPPDEPGAICPCPEGLLIGWPPHEESDHPLFRVAYVIDINAVNSRQAAELAHQLMTEPKSLPPVLHVLNAAGTVVPVDLSVQ
jgi:hypothetical protein